MLRESSQIAAEAVELRDVMQGSSEATSIRHAALLVEFAESVVSRDTARIAAALRTTMEE